MMYVPITKDIEETEDMKIYELPGGKMAKIIHKGPYDSMEQSYDKLFNWIAQNGSQLLDQLGKYT